ncbi:hypothetical protein BH11MYX1_BH11MYX1_52020 [soil metagenome]
MLPEITERVRPPRALSVPYPLGFPLGAANDPTLQHLVLRALLAQCARSDVPSIAVFDPAFDPAGDR